MSWSVTVNNVKEFEGFDEKTLKTFLEANIEYAVDAVMALTLAKKRHLHSATLSGGRTPNPVTGEDVVIITVTGFTSSIDFIEAMKKVIEAGPDV